MKGGSMDKDKSPEDKLKEKVGTDSRKKIRSKKEGREIMSNIGVFGMVGWTVAIPALIGIAIGGWLDRRYESTVSWTITMLVVGMTVGCINAWRWVNEKRKGD